MGWDQLGKVLTVIFTIIIVLAFGAGWAFAELLKLLGGM